jgi:hypothetical protein
VIGGSQFTGTLILNDTTNAAEGGEMIFAYAQANPGVPTGFTIDAFFDGSEDILRVLSPNAVLLELEADGELNVNGSIEASGEISAASFTGDGSGLTGISSSSVWTGSPNILYNSGNVGIGLGATSDINAPLHVLGQLRLEDANDYWEISGGGDFFISNSAAQEVFTIFGNTGNITIGNGTIGDGGTDVQVNGDVTADAFIGDGSGLTGISSSSVWTGSPNIFYNGGFVGIGTDTPLEPLHVVGEGNADAIFTEYAPSSSTSINLQKSRGTVAAPSPILNGDRIGSLVFAGWNGTDFAGGEGARIIVDAVEDFGTSAGTQMQFQTDIAGDGSYNLQTRMTIAGDGHVGIGTESPASALEVVGTITATAFVGDGSGLSGVTATASPDFGSQNIVTTGSVTANSFVGDGSGLTGITSTPVNVEFPGMENIFIGELTLPGSLTGSANVALGSNAGEALTSGSGNIFIGDDAGFAVSTGDANVFIGDATGNVNSTGSNNVFIGISAGLNTTSSSNVFIGSSAGSSNTAGTENVFVGASAGQFNTGSFNTFVGYESGFSNTSGSSNSFYGRNSGQVNTTGSDNAFIGISAGASNTTGSSNTFVGALAGIDNTSGNENVFVGQASGLSNTTGFGNTFLGSATGTLNIDGRHNTFIGNSTGDSNTSGEENTFIGAFSGGANSSGISNTYVGYSSGADATGSENVFLGLSAGSAASGSRNVFIGVDAGPQTMPGGSDNIFIGYNAGQDDLSSNKLIIENSSASTPLIYGEFDDNIVGINRNASTNTLEVGGTASKSSAGDWLANSDKRIKKDIKEIQNSFELMKALRPVKFKYTDYWKEKNPSITDKYYYNFIAQEFQKVFPEAVKGSGEFIEGDPEEILQIDTYNAQITAIQAVKDLIAIVEQLQQENASLKSKNSSLEQRVSSMEASLDRIEQLLQGYDQSTFNDSVQGE